MQGQSGRDDPTLPLIEDLGFAADDRVDEPIHGRPLRQWRGLRERNETNDRPVVSLDILESG